LTKRRIRAVGRLSMRPVEEGLGLGVDPVEILEEHEQRLDLAFPEE
jgi:hypothetical protein